jgi:hypothetical protein
MPRIKRSPPPPQLRPEYARLDALAFVVLSREDVTGYRLPKSVRDRYGQVGAVLVRDWRGQNCTLLGHAGYVALLAAARPVPGTVTPIPKVLAQLVVGWPDQWPVAEAGRELRLRTHRVFLSRSKSRAVLPAAA